MAYDFDRARRLIKANSNNLTKARIITDDSDGTTILELRHTDGSITLYNITKFGDEYDVE